MSYIKNTNDQLEKLMGRRLCTNITCRMKSYDRAIGKLERKNYPVTLEGLKTKIFDVAGCKIVTLFKDDIYVFRDVLVNHPKMELIEEIDYVKDPKSNGYRSLHLIVSVQIPILLENFQTQTKSVPVEIQIRSQGMELWGEVEHYLCYANDNPNANAPEELKPIADYIDKSDDLAVRLRKNEPKKKSTKSKKTN